MSEWIKAEEYCVSVFDGTHDTPKVTETGYKLVTSKNILSNTLDLNSAYYISEEDFVNINKRSKVKQYDILFSMIGTVGSLYFETSDTIDYAIKNIGVFSCGNKEKAEWLYYYLQSSYAQQYIKRYLNGAVQKFLPLKGLREFPVPQFNKELHNRIKILLNIDQKIQINNQINQELEAMAKTLYDYWFVQFDFPDQNGKPYKSSGGKMAYNQDLKREIPEGWRVETLKNFESKIITGKTPSRANSDNFGGEIPFITIGDIRGNTFVYSTSESLTDLGASVQQNKYLPEGSLCVSCIATVGEIGFTTEWSHTNQQINSIVFEDETNRYYLYFALKNYFENANASAKTGNTFANMNKEDFSGIRIILPRNEIKNNFHKITEPYFAQIKCLQGQNQELTQLRDWLLPMLMNGQVKVE
ncbi:restriction endonuclease subunit S [Streptococcus gordonii]|uniref:restriction endonuclease subunit S n=1 Tax=Streptococcus gordonii TaxID=1302 RepID=UPI0022850FAE|nr:restriction endonuclease subunit S [Streptococcus gordonii]MCY7135495.1 restriction endonuclease subunit S [Streptococcus gordonii]